MLLLCGLHAACPRDSFKDVPGNGPCVQCGSDRVTAHNGSSSRLDCQCVNDPCADGILVLNYDHVLYFLLNSNNVFIAVGLSKQVVEAMAYLGGGSAAMPLYSP